MALKRRGRRRRSRSIHRKKCVRNSSSRRIPAAGKQTAGRRKVKYDTPPVCQLFESILARASLLQPHLWSVYSRKLKALPCAKRRA
jgi:hypothetical protein